MTVLAGCGATSEVVGVHLSGCGAFWCIRFLYVELLVCCQYGLLYAATEMSMAVVHASLGQLCECRTDSGHGSSAELGKVLCPVGHTREQMLLLPREGFCACSLLSECACQPCNTLYSVC